MLAKVGKKSENAPYCNVFGFNFKKYIFFCVFISGNGVFLSHIINENIKGL